MKVEDWRQRVSQIFSYLHEVKNLTQPVEYDMSRYETIAWIKDLPQVHGCYVLGQGSDKEACLEIYKQVIPPPPAVPHSISDWVDGKVDDPASNIKSKGKIMVNDIEIFFDEDESRVKQWNEWFKLKWVPWAEENKLKKKIHDIYGQLFALLQRIEREGDNLEILWGDGVLTWSLPEGNISRPLLTTRLELSFDRVRGIFYIKPINGSTTLELDMFTGIEIANIDYLVKLESTVKSEGLDGLDSSLIKPLIKEIVNTLSPDGKCDLSGIGGKPSFNGKEPSIYNAPVIFLRNQSARLWHKELKQIIAAIEGGLKIPNPIRMLVDESTSSSESSTYSDHIGQTFGDDELLFPLPANEDQKEIVRRLEQNYGVVVQGPPGTGKSHTIANITSHLLANGKRVLITSHTEKALKVLADKIPEEIRSLCVSVLGGDTKSIKKIEESVQSICENVASFDTESLGKEVKETKVELKTCRSEIAELKFRLKKCAEKENQEVELEDHKWKPETMARWVKDNELVHGWLPDSVNLNTQIPLSQSEMEQFFELSNLLHNDKEALERSLPDSDNLPSGLDFEKIIEGIINQEKIVDINCELLKGWTYRESWQEDLSELIELVDSTKSKLEAFSGQWFERVLKDVLFSEARGKLWKDLYKDLRKEVEEIRGINTKLLSYDVRLPEVNSDLQDHLVSIKKELLEKGKLGWWFINVGGRSIRKTYDSVLLDNNKLKSPEDVDIVLEYIKLSEMGKKVNLKWNRSVAEVNGLMLEYNDNGWLTKLEDLLQNLEVITEWEAVVEPINHQVKHFGILTQAKWDNLQWFNTLKQGLEAISAKQELERRLKKANEVRLYLERGVTEPHSHRIWLELIQALKERNTELWRTLTSEVRRLEGLRTDYDKYVLLRKSLERVLPRWVSQIDQQLSAGIPVALSKDFKQAFHWSQMNNYIEELHREYCPEQISEAIEIKRRREKLIIEELVTKSTWLKLLEAITDKQKRALVAWIQAIKKIGKGTGKHAAHWRQVAKSEMEICKRAIPVWIMPLHRVIENFDVRGKQFDVIIIDESSQSDLFALSALLRAKKVIVVGDDRQISPDAVGIDQGKVFELIRRYLDEVPQKDSYDVKTSLFDTALRILPGKIMLKEHFRCVPEIIQFSNDLAYGGDIEPLRVAGKREKFDEPVVACRVANGWRSEGTKVYNEPEAEALVDTIIECCKDPRYNGKSMGVISLQGSHQASLIEQMLLERLGAEEIISRGLICGDAYSFQGDERDIMFLSLVVAKNVRFGALTKKSDDQRFNVAASRAKDQMWLFHSVDLDELNPDCIRARLLRYCLDPQRVFREEREVEHLFDSQFERDVFRLVSSRGYSIRPQVWIGRKYRIDFVIEGLDARLAVECDGDKWHGPEQWEQDMERQMILERAGWRFWRVRASTFYRNPDQAMQGLWSKLKEMGIESVTLKNCSDSYVS